jgi:hypothetical protein
MGMPGIDVVAQRFPINTLKPTTPDGKPDLADVIYGVHRCSHSHGDELPASFELIANAVAPAGITEIAVERGKAQLSDRIIFGMFAVGSSLAS